MWNKTENGTFILAMAFEARIPVADKGKRVASLTASMLQLHVFALRPWLLRSCRDFSSFVFCGVGCLDLFFFLCILVVFCIVIHFFGVWVCGVSVSCAMLMWCE